MPPPPHTKPENVLKRAHELIGVGQPQAALSLLHEHVTSKRTRNNPIASIEPVMLLFVELCVDLRKGKAAKDGLYSYKNTAQNTNIGTIELVLSKFIELAESKVTEAQDKAEAETTTIDDLEATETPESVLLSTVSGEQSRDRTDRAIVTPWLKFLWETYRTVLDILKNNARLETLYQSTAHQAFQFCKKYTRKTEFRRLCELLRNHLQNAAKYQSQIHAINLNDSDTLQRHLDTRFQQLNVAVDLELWQEAFRSIEDIHTLLNLSKRPAKPVMMANYFQKLATIFLVGENYLFHAAAYSRYLQLSTHNDTSFVVLAALAIPVISTSRVVETRTKNQRLSNLLGLSTSPTRASLFKEIQAKGQLKRARPEILELYNILEVDFHPLSICKRIAPILEQIGADDEMSKYVSPLRQVILTRLFQQLSQVYESVEYKFVLDLAQGDVEKFVMNGCKNGHLKIRIDHAKGVLAFDSDVFSPKRSEEVIQSTPAEIVRSQLSRLAKTLFVTCQHVDAASFEEQRVARLQTLSRAESGMDKEHNDNLVRRDVIAQKKQAAATAAAQKKREEETRSKLKAQELEQAEQRRIAEQNRERDQKRIKAEQERVQKQEMESQLKELQAGRIKIDLTDVNLDEIDTTRIRILKLQALEKEKNELSERLRIVGKRNDHLERAFRREEIKHIPEDYEAQRKRDLEEYQIMTATTLQESKETHAENVALKKRLTRLVETYEEFRNRVRTERRAQFAKQRKVAERELQQKKDARIKEFRDRKLRERLERQERELAQREEDERLEREAEEKAAAEEERRARLAEEKSRREEERRRLDEQAAKQRQREAEIESRLSRKEPEAPPRTGLGKPTGGWRERLAAKEGAPALGGTPGGPRKLVSDSNYVPPQQRTADREEQRSTSRFTAERPSMDRATSERAMPERVLPERTTAESIPAERTAAEKMTVERPAVEKTTMEKPAAGKYVPGAFKRNK